jgi:type IV pilus assembly protein PilY1
MDDSYRLFRKKYLNRRTVVYAGANDGMLHAFNGGFYDEDLNKFKLQNSGETQFELGAELWAYVPNALLPHLKWLKEELNENIHVYYVDLKPRIFDAKIFTVDDDHPGGWGTVLLGGMRLGGGPIGVDITVDGAGNPDPDGIDDLNFRSTYFALDITNPEKPPKLLWSFSDENLGFTTCYPTPIIVGNEWFIVVGSGPNNYDATCETGYGGSNRLPSLYILNAYTGVLEGNFTMNEAGPSFLANPIAVDFDLATTTDNVTGETLWTGEAIYVASDGCNATGSEGQVFRIKTNQDEDPNNWTKGVFFNPNTTAGDHQHINSALSVAKDDKGRIWVYFGTGRFWSTLDRQSRYLEYQNSFYGIKEPVDANGALTYATPGAQKGNLLNVTGIEVIEEGEGEYNNLFLPIGASVSNHDDDGNITFSDLLAEVDARDGWYLNFSETGERNLGQAAILGDIVTFSTFVPNNDLCQYEGESYLYGLYYKTGTAYWKGVLKTNDNNGTGIDPDTNKVIYKLDLGKGYSETPNIHTGREEGSKAFVQTSTGAIIGIEQMNPGITKSKKASWEEWPR